MESEIEFFSGGMYPSPYDSEFHWSELDEELEYLIDTEKPQYQLKKGNIFKNLKAKPGYENDHVKFEIDPGNKFDYSADFIGFMYPDHSVSVRIKHPGVSNKPDGDFKGVWQKLSNDYYIIYGEWREDKISAYYFFELRR